MLMVSCAAAQSVRVQKVTAAKEGADVRVEITLSSPVTPAVETASHPDRILLDLPGTTCTEETRQVGVHANGVRQVRTAQHSTHPLITRLVVDLDGTHPYTLKSEGNRIVVIVSPPLAARRNTRQGAPAAATSGTLIGIFRRRQEAPAATSNEEDLRAVPLPPPPPAVVPAAATPTANTTTAAVPADRQPAPVLQSAPVAASRQSSSGEPSFAQTQIATAAPPPDPSAGNPALPAATPKTDTVQSAPIPSPPVENRSEASKIDDSSSTALLAPAVADVPPVATAAPMLIARSDDPSLRTVFKVKYVAEGVAYLEGGRAQGLAEGMKLQVQETTLPTRQGDTATAGDPRFVADLEVSAVAETSAVTDIHSAKRPVKAGDLAYLSSGDAAALVQQRALSATRQYPAVISFTEGDTLDEEARAEVPRPPLPSVNRARGRIGLDYMNTLSHGVSDATSSDVGLVFRGDITRIGGTYWNLSGYWRGRLTAQSAASQQTLQNLINRTYHLSMTYDNPNSSLVAGFGRLYLPWAPSLDTIDGGYLGKRLSKGTTLGIFAGSTPDPSSWDYSPDRVIGGTFINFDGGEYDGLHYSSTAGVGVSMVKWSIDRPFLFLEDTLSYGRHVAVYESAQFDSPKGNSSTPPPGAGLGRNFFTLRVNPHPRVELDLNYNYFRDIPTFDVSLVGTSLLDKFLFQGFSAGVRVEVVKQVFVSTNLGRSTRTGDSQPALNEMFGITLGRLPWLRLRADAHYARFNSSFGTGSYESFTISRQFSDNLRLELLAGQQNFNSEVTTNDRSRFVTGTVETTLGPHYYVQGNFTVNRGSQLSYDQWMFSLGYRFDSKRHHE